LYSNERHGTDGGGLAILAFVQEQVVTQFHWLTAQDFLDGLALGRLTPGPPSFNQVGRARRAGRRRAG
jgi:chromate transport protein ChrA